jgi:hypothetical protein
MYSLEEHRVPGVDEAFYIRDFVTEAEAVRLEESVYSAPKPKWKTLRNRRLQNWGGLPSHKGKCSRLSYCSLLQCSPPLSTFFSRCYKQETLQAL